MSNKQPQVKRYKVLIHITDDESGKSWIPGEFISDGELPVGVIHSFVTMTPPALAVVKAKEPPAPKPTAADKGDTDDGRDA